MSRPSALGPEFRGALSRFTRRQDQSKPSVLLSVGFNSLPLDLATRKVDEYVRGYCVSKTEFDPPVWIFHRLAAGAGDDGNLIARRFCPDTIPTDGDQREPKRGLTHRV